MSLFAALFLSSSVHAAEPIPFEPTVLVRIREDRRLCAQPMCGGWFYQDTRNELTECVDGTFANACYVGALDLGALAIDESNVDRLLEAAQTGRAVLEVQLIDDGAYGVLAVVGAYREDRIAL